MFKNAHQVSTFSKKTKELAKFILVSLPLQRWSLLAGAQPEANVLRGLQGHGFPLATASSTHGSGACSALHKALGGQGWRQAPQPSEPFIVWITLTHSRT